jgi:conjugative transfer signal peptidase TraF
MRSEDAVAAAMTLGVAFACAGFLHREAPLVLWNATASAPVGLYRVSPFATPRAGDYAVVRPDPALSAWLAAAGYLPARVPLLKQVAAVSGQKVCRSGDRITVEGRTAALARRRDRLGRRLPLWDGCRRLRAGELFLLNTPPDSLDGRYFGATAARDVLGRAQPIFARARP